MKLSLIKKIVWLVCIAGFLPVGIILILSLSEMQSRSTKQQIYALNQGYEQVMQALNDNMSRVHNISTLLAVNETINSSLISFEAKRDLADQLLEFEYINSYAYTMEMTMDESNILFFLDEELPVVDSNSVRYRSLNRVKDTDWYKKLDANNGRPTWVKLEGNVAIARKLWDTQDYNKDIGVLAVQMDSEYFEAMLISAIPEEQLYIETLDGDILFQNVSEDRLVLIPANKIAMRDQAYREVEIEGEVYLVKTWFMDTTGTYLVSLVAKAALQEQIRQMNFRTFLIFILFCFIGLLTLLPMTKSVTNRIQLLKVQMSQIRDGIINKIEIGQQSDEIDQLIEYYNKMVDDVERLMKEQYILGQEKTDAELKALQSQINPHFLYNTLDMINWMAQRDETENIKEVVQAMSKFYRLTLSKGHDIVSIADEIKMCQAYMEIQKRRYKGKINYEVEIDDDILEYLIPKITLQPFLENAIIHGISEKESGRGVIILNGWLEDGRITLSVTDDGNGIDENSKKVTTTGSHYGMENIAKRLSLFYKEEIPIQIESSLGVGTCVIIEIPAVKKTEEGDIKA